MRPLRDRMEQDLILRRLSPATRRNYLLYCRKFAAHYGHSPEDLGEAEIRDFLLHWIQVEQISYATYRQVLAALKFLYTVTLMRAWEVERIPFPRPRRQSFPEVLRQDKLIGRGVDSPFLDACAAQAVRSHPALRSAGQPQCFHQIAVLSGAPDRPQLLRFPTGGHDRSIASRTRRGLFVLPTMSLDYK